jgi:hypothetical protein
MRQHIGCSRAFLVPFRSDHKAALFLPSISARGCGPCNLFNRIFIIVIILLLLLLSSSRWSG